MPRAFYVNIANVDIGGKAPGQVFQILTTDTGEPAEAYWRKRLAEGAIAPNKSAAADSPASKSSASDEASPKKSAKKGA